jgi:hypothetical protein
MYCEVHAVYQFTATATAISMYDNCECICWICLYITAGEDNEVACTQGCSDRQSSYFLILNNFHEYIV